MGFTLLSVTVHATNLAVDLTSRTCLTIIEFSEYFERLSPNFFTTD